VAEAVDNKAWPETKISSIDLDDYIARFANLTNGKYGTSSISVYKSRMARAMDWYTKFLNEPGWMPQIKTRVQTGSKKQKPPEAIHEPAPQTDSPGIEIVQRPAQIINNALLYPFPLENGEVAQISLPREISQHDAERLSNFIKTLVIEHPYEQ
jgi:hypothetical protein